MCETLWTNLSETLKILVCSPLSYVNIIIKANKETQRQKMFDEQHLIDLKR